MYEQSGRVYDASDTAPTLHTNGGGNQETKIYVPQESRVRKLTPLECWRLMGFTDDDFYTAREGLIETHYNGRDRANTQLYKQAGNSIVIEGILKNLIPEERDRKKEILQWLDSIT